MNNVLKLIGLAVCIIGIFYIWRSCSPDNYTEQSNTTEVSIDTTIVDSLRSVIASYESIDSTQRDTIRDTVYIEVPSQVNDSTNKYVNSYSDSTLNAEITSVVSAKRTNNMYEGYLQSQEFSYTIKQERVRTVTDSIFVTRTKTITNTKTLVKQPKPYFTIGAEIGKHTFGPIVGFTKPEQYHVFYRYDLTNNSHSLGFAIPITFQ